MSKNPSYELFKLLVIGGAAWILVLIFLYPSPDRFELNWTNYEKLNEEIENEKTEQPKENIRESVEEIYPEIAAPPNIFGIEGLGEQGVAVTMPENLPLEIKSIYDKGWKKNSFNQYLSDLISLHRTLPDYRSNHCKEIASEYSKNLPTTSVIITFHNEAWSTLLRSVHSVLDRSPEHLIEEIILVDDFSDMGL